MEREKELIEDLKSIGIDNSISAEDFRKHFFQKTKFKYLWMSDKEIGFFLSLPSVERLSLDEKISKFIDDHQFNMATHIGFPG